MAPAGSLSALQGLFPSGWGKVVPRSPGATGSGGVGGGQEKDPANRQRQIALSLETL